VARWADVTEFTVTYYESEDTAARVNGFTVRTDTGTRLSSLRPFWGRSELRTTVAEAHRFLAPRLVPALTEAYESGAAAEFGQVRVSQAGVTVRPPADDLIPWTEIKSIRMTYIGAADYVYEIIIGRTGKPTQVIDRLPRGSRGHAAGRVRSGPSAHCGGLAGAVISTVTGGTRLRRGGTGRRQRTGSRTAQSESARSGVRAPPVTHISTAPQVSLRPFTPADRPPTASHQPSHRPLVSTLRTLRPF